MEHSLRSASLGSPSLGVCLTAFLILTGPLEITFPAERLYILLRTTISSCQPPLRSVCLSSTCTPRPRFPPWLCSNLSLCSRTERIDKGEAKRNKTGVDPYTQSSLGSLKYRWRIREAPGHITMPSDQVLTT